MKNFKIILSQDRKSAIIYLPKLNKSFKFYDSYGDVMILVEDFLLTPIGDN